MAIELSLGFPDPAQVVVRLDEDDDISEAAAQPFAGPLDAASQRELQWYLEVYPVQYATDVDDARARAIANRLKDWGAALFRPVFTSGEARRLFYRFQDRAEDARLLTVASKFPAVLGQPWELLCDPDGTYLFLERPRISVRRRLAGVGGGRKPFQPVAKDKLHVLFVVSRPDDAGFIDPRADAQAVLDAIDSSAPGRFAVEFLRPATLSGLTMRLEDDHLPVVDVIHFDGHGAYDADGALARRRARTRQAGGGAQIMRGEEPCEPHQGYLLFEDADGLSDLVSAEKLGDLLHRQRVGLVVLSACKSAAVGGEDPMGCVAARVVHAGLPSVLAMTHSVLVDTTRALFGHVYGELAQGRATGLALDNARRQLYANPGRGERQRSAGRITLELQDWFVPALYQAGRSVPLLTSGMVRPAPEAAADTIAAVQESGFHGRRRELWNIERWFVGGTRRVVVSGFGGQGKTYLAEEAARWLRRTGLFTRVCFVSFADFQGSDPAALAVSTLSTVLGKTLIDPAEAAEALRREPTLLILDNLEALGASLPELLDAATAWSEQGASRVLITTRPDTLNHANYKREGSNVCRFLNLQGLAEDDALDWFQALMKLPPTPEVALPAREALAELFGRVAFHPLSIGVLAQQLKQRRVAELGERLEALLPSEGSPLLASLALSLDRLPTEFGKHLPGLSVFQGGAFEDDLMAVTGINPATWQGLRLALEQAGLIRIETVPGYGPPFLRFHPTLAPALSNKLLAEQRNDVAARYRAQYQEVARYLYFQKKQHGAVVMGVAERDLPNLLAAVREALDQNDPGVVNFASYVCDVLLKFARRRDIAELRRRMQQAVERDGADRLIARWHRAEQLMAERRFADAEVLLQDLIDGLGPNPSFEKCTCLLSLARCAERPDKAETILRRALADATALEASPAIRDKIGALDSVREKIGALRTDLGDVLRDRGEYEAAKAEYEAGAAIKREQSNDRGLAVTLVSLGTLAAKRGDPDEAVTRYIEAKEMFEALGEQLMVAECCHDLGVVYADVRQFEMAESSYRQAARILEAHGNVAALGNTWGQLATMLVDSGRPDLAEPWYRKALAASRAAGDTDREGNTLNNLARMLADQPGELEEARKCAEAALDIKSRLDHASTQIWVTYNVLAAIAAAQGDEDAARLYRERSRAEFATAPAAGELIRRLADFIAAIVACARQPARRPEIETKLARMIGHRDRDLAVAVRAILDGARDEAILCEPLSGEASVVVKAVLQATTAPPAV